MTPSDSSDDLFQEAMAAVTPIETPKKIQAKKKPKRHATASPAPISTHHPSGPRHRSVPVRITSDTLLANGISQERLKRLAGGDPPIDFELDLHGCNRDRSLELLDISVSRMLQNGQRVLCIVHGRGLHSSDQMPVLKQTVYQWLLSGPANHEILAAIPKPGTRGGSCLVMLRRQKDQF